MEFKTLAIDKIFIAPDRLRRVDMDFVHMLHAETSVGQFVDPILVRKTPNRKGFPYTLIDGEHRIKERKLAGEDEIPCIVVKADADEAEMLEAGANIFRHISPLDRALAIHGYRKAWERKHGEIKRGGDQSDIMSVCSDDLEEEEVEASFSQACAERMGMSERSVERSVRIATRLPLALIEKLRGTSIAHTQTQLIALSKLDDKKLAAAAEIFDLAEGDYDRMMELLNIREPKRDPKLQAYSRMIDSWERIPKAHKWHVLDYMGVREILTDEQKKKLEEAFGAPEPEGDIV